YWYYDRHRSVRLVILVGLAIDQIAQSGLSSLSVIYYSAQLFSECSDEEKRLAIQWVSELTDELMAKIRSHEYSRSMDVTS
ncbi:hypothetical protein J7S62_22345, partial [Citrobacter freundii]|nr:hypothetical protein [Citrobacter freundii]